MKVGELIRVLEQFPEYRDVEISISVESRGGQLRTHRATATEAAETQSANSSLATPVVVIR